MSYKMLYHYIAECREHLTENTYRVCISSSTGSQNINSCSDSQIRFGATGWVCQTVNFIPEDVEIVAQWDVVVDIVTVKGEADLDVST